MPPAGTTSRSSSPRSASAARSSSCRTRSSASSRSRSSPCASRIGALVLWPLARRRPARRGELRDGLWGGARPPRRLRLPDDRPAVHRLGHLRLHHLPARGVRAAPRLRPPSPAPAPGHARGRRPSPSCGLVLLTDPGGGWPGSARARSLTLGLRGRLRRSTSLILGETARRHDPIRLAAIQVAVVGAGLRRPGPLPRAATASPAAALAAAVATAVVATAAGLRPPGGGPAGACPRPGPRCSSCSSRCSPGSWPAFTDDPLGGVQLVGAGRDPRSPSSPARLGPGARLDRGVKMREAGLDNDRYQGESGWLIRRSPGRRSRRGTGGRSPGSSRVEESARRVGHYKWIEMRLFEVLGGWVATVPELDVKLRLGTHCYHHAWHAELWHKRLPELREMNPERLTVAAERRARGLRRRPHRARGPRPHDREARRRLPRAHPGQDRGVHVPPEQHVHDHRRPDHPVAQVHPPGRVRGLARRRDDAPVAHRDPDELQRAIDHQAKLQQLLLAAGGIAGPGTIGDSYSTEEETHA